MMKLKLVGVVASLALMGSVVACSNTSDNQAAPNATANPASSTGDAMKNEGGAMKNEGGAMKNEGGAMKNEGGAMKNEGGAMKKEGASATPSPTATP